MKDYTVLEALKRTAASKIENAFERGYEQGFKDCHSELTEEEAKAHYDAGYNEGYSAGCKDAYEIGKKDGQKSERMLLHEPLKKDLEEAYQKGLKHGQELRVKEAECAEACGMKRAWEAARKLVLSEIKGGLSCIEIYAMFAGHGYNYVLENYTVSEVIAKLEAREKKQEEKQSSSVVPAPPLVSCFECLKYPLKCSGAFDNMKSHCTDFEKKQDASGNYSSDMCSHECKNCVNRWIPTSERYPKIEDEYKYFLVTDDKGEVSVQEFFISLDEEPQSYFSGMRQVIAWKPLPEPYQPKDGEVKE